MLLIGIEIGISGLCLWNKPLWGRAANWPDPRVPYSMLCWLIHPTLRLSETPVPPFTLGLREAHLSNNH